MAEMLAAIGAVAFFAIAVAAAFRASWLEWRVLQQLERAHPDVIRHFDESRGPTSRLLRRFIWRDRHEAMGDARLSRMVNGARVAWIGAGGSLVAAVIAFKCL
jgi:hypothetical protein